MVKLTEQMRHSAGLITLSMLLGGSTLQWSGGYRATFVVHITTYVVFVSFWLLKMCC